MQLAATVDTEFVGIVRFLDPKRHVVHRLAQQALANLPTRDVLALAPAKRRGIDLERHADRRLVDDERRQAFRPRGIADRIGDLRPLDACEGNDVARGGFLDFDALEPEKAEHLDDALAADVAVSIDDCNRAVTANLAALDTADADGTDIARVVELTHLQLERSLPVHVGRRAVLDDRLEQRRHVLGEILRIVAGEAAERGRIDDREVELFFARAELVEKVERLVEHPIRTRLVAIDLVDDDDGTQPVAERLLRDEPRLRHRSVDCIDEQQHRVDHREHALHFAAEIGVARRVDDVDAIVLPADCRVLREDRDAALTLERIRVHHALGRRLARIERARLFQELIDECRLAMIDVRDDGDVAELGRGHGRRGLGEKGRAWYRNQGAMIRGSRQKRG